MNLNQIKQLREQTGASIADCKDCLEKAGGNFAEALELVRRKGADIARKKSSRTTSEGFIGSYVHLNGRIASFVAVRCETDFVARNKEFRELAKNIAMQVAAMNPLYLSPESIPEEVNEKEKRAERENLQKDNKPEQVIEQIVEGKLKKFYSRVCLLNQPFIKDDKRTIDDLIKENIQKLGENIEIGEFVRLEL